MLSTERSAPGIIRKYGNVNQVKSDKKNQCKIPHVFRKSVPKFGHFRSLHDVPVHSATAINEYLDIDSGRPLPWKCEQIIVARNFLVDRMLPREDEMV